MSLLSRNPIQDTAVRSEIFDIHCNRNNEEQSQHMRVVRLTVPGPLKEERNVSGHR
jgi:hypothetical protein